MSLVYMLFLSSILRINARDIIIPDALCFEKYTSDLYKVGNELSREIRPDHNLQLTAIENALGIPTPEQGYALPLSVPLCSLIVPPSNYTLATYNTVNKLHMERIKAQLINNRVLFRLMMIQKKILSN
jgi:hypothetical protein